MWSQVRQLRGDRWRGKSGQCTTGARANPSVQLWRREIYIRGQEASSHSTGGASSQGMRSNESERSQIRIVSGVLSPPMQCSSDQLHGGQVNGCLECRRMVRGTSDRVTEIIPALPTSRGTAEGLPTRKGWCWRGSQYDQQSRTCHAAECQWR